MLRESFVSEKKYSRWQSRTGSSSPARTPNLQLATEQPSARECWIPPKKKKKDTPGQRKKL